MKYVQIGKDEGATLACGGHASTRAPTRKGFFHEPTVFTDVDAGDADRAGRDLRARWSR